MNMTSGSEIMALFLAMLCCVIGLLEAAPMQGKTAAEEMELKDLINQGRNGIPEFNSHLSKDHSPHTKVLVQKTKIVIPVPDDKPAPTPAPVAPVIEEEEEVEPMQFVAPPEQPMGAQLSEEEAQFLYPADYQLNEPQEQQFQPMYDEQLSMTPSELDLTPRAVAEYLILTGDFRGFDEAISDLLTAGMLTIRQADQYRYVVSQEYERLMSDMVEAEADYVEEQQPQEMEPTEMELREQLSQDAEAGQLLQALLQDYMSSEPMDASSQEYEDFLDWMEQSLKENQIEQAVPVSQQEMLQENPIPEANDLVEKELETLPVQEAEEEASGDVEQSENILSPNLLSSTQKKLKKALEAEQ